MQDPKWSQNKNFVSKSIENKLEERVETYAREEKGITFSTEWEGAQKLLQKKVEEMLTIHMGWEQGSDWN